LYPLNSSLLLAESGKHFVWRSLKTFDLCYCRIARSVPSGSSHQERMVEMAQEKPTPKPSPVSKTYWEKAAQQELWIQRCNDCSAYFFYPRVLCPECWGDNLQWSRVSGKGTIYTYTVVHRSDLQPFAEKTPYVLAVVELEEGPRMTANVVNCPVDRVRIGMPVRVVFEPTGDEHKLPQFEPQEG